MYWKAGAAEFLDPYELERTEGNINAELVLNKPYRKPIVKARGFVPFGIEEAE